MTALEVAAVGDNCIDRYLSLRCSTVGGNAANVAVHLARHNLKAGYFGAVGNDGEGERVLAALRENHVDVAHTRVDDSVTAWTDIEIADGGDRMIGAEEFGACARYRPSYADVAILYQLKHVHIGWLNDGGALKSRLAAAGVGVSQDLSVNLASQSRGAAGLAVAFASAGPSVAEGERLLASLIAEGAGTAVVTCAALGSLATRGHGIARASAHKIDVVDTLGAGDTFIAGFLAGRVRGLDLAECLEVGHRAAATTCGHLGGFPQTPLEIA